MLKSKLRESVNESTAMIETLPDVLKERSRSTSSSNSLTRLARVVSSKKDSPKSIEPTNSLKDETAGRANSQLNSSTSSGGGSSAVVGLSSHSSQSSFVSAEWPSNGVEASWSEENANKSSTASTQNSASQLGDSSMGGCGDSTSLVLRKNAAAKETSSYKKQKENYETEKRRITNDILTIMRDERIIILADWLKVRGSLKNWIKLYCILKPGIMLLFKSDKPKAGQWVGTLLLGSCQLLERPSKKHGFCFKLFHPLERSIWASKGPAGETYINVPYILLPTFYLIFRAPSEPIGQIWMEAIELALRSQGSSPTLPMAASKSTVPTSSLSDSSFRSSSRQDLLMASKPSSSSLLEKRVSDVAAVVQQLQPWTDSTKTTTSKYDSMPILTEDVASSPNDAAAATIPKSSKTNHAPNSNSSDDMGSLNSSLNQMDDDDDDEDMNEDEEEDDDENFADDDDEDSGGMGYELVETKYTLSPMEEFGEGQTEEVAEENKSLIFCLVKQVRPGMDLSKVVLPTFILEPRSFLEKLTDFYYHSDILTEAANNDDPYERMKAVVKFYLSGFYKKPKGLKKPYNPILGEVFRSYWYNPKTDSKTFYIAEQVSHHPPISSFYVTNRKEGFCIYGTVLARSKFYGNSVSAIMDGQVKLILLGRGEEYVITMPYANCKGILIGKLTMELGGKVCIQCAKTGYSSEIEFKLKPLLGGIDASNLIEGKIKFAKETLAVIRGKWDSEIVLEERKSCAELEPVVSAVLWSPSQDVVEKRLKRYVVPVDTQREFESEKLWQKVSEAIKNCDQNLATLEKTVIENRQREHDAERRAKLVDYQPRFFAFDTVNKEWVYKYSDLRPWDPQTDLFQYESEFRISTKTKHKLKQVIAHSTSPPVVRPPSALVMIRPRDTAGKCSANDTSSIITASQRIRHRHHSIVSNMVDESATNSCVCKTAESIDSAFSVEMKQRLESIEDHLKELTKKIDLVEVMVEPSGNNNNNDARRSPRYSKLRISDFSGFTFTAAFVFFFAWLIGLLSAFVYLRVFSFF